MPRRGGEKRSEEWHFGCHMKFEALAEDPTNGFKASSNSVLAARFYY